MSNGLVGNPPPRAARPPRRARARASLFAQGEPMLWLTGGGLVVAIAMIVGLLGLISVQGIGTLWPVTAERFALHDGRAFLGEVTRSEAYRPTADDLASLPPEVAGRLRRELGEPGTWTAMRHLVRTGNFDLTGEHFTWISDFQVRERTRPRWVLVLERQSWGRFYGEPQGFLTDGTMVAEGAGGAWAEYVRLHPFILQRRHERRRLETHDTGAVNQRIEKARLRARDAELKHGVNAAVAIQARAEFTKIEAEAGREFDRIRASIQELNAENNRYRLRLLTADGRTADISLDEIVRAYPPNQLSWGGRVGVYLARWREFLLAEPREANMEGGIFPAIFGTVVMTLLMSLAVVPFGVTAALYLREYAKAGPMVSAVRISINNLAGVPSIVFGVFGLGFFCYLVGAGIDELLFAAKLPNPTYGKGGILWASLTLALLTLPVVIVATEEALAAVPNSMREGSYACGASKWQTILRIVLPRAMPGIMTGMILAMARGAGEVAPLMLVGAVKLAPELPLDHVFPYIHPERSFMHLGFHIYDLGFQSQNSEAAKPMVFTTTLLLIALVFLLNVLAVHVRKRLRKKFQSAVF